MRRSPKLDPLTAIPDANPLRSREYQTASTPMIGTLAPPLPRPVKNRPRKAIRYEPATPVTNIAVPTRNSETTMTRRSPNLEAATPPSTASTRYPVILDAARSPVWAIVRERPACIEGRMTVYPNLPNPRADITTRTLTKEITHRLRDFNLESRRVSRLVICSHNWLAFFDEPLEGVVSRRIRPEICDPGLPEIGAFLRWKSLKYDSR